MPNTSRMKWPVPGENTDPWFDGFIEMMDEVDASVYAAREDRNIIGTGGGNFTFTVSSGVVTWAGTIGFLAANTGFLWQIAAGNVTLEDGQMWYVSIPRAPIDNTTVLPVVASNLSAVPDGDAALVIAVRVGSKVYFRNGKVMADGDTFAVFEATGAGGGGGSGTTALIFRPGSAFTGPAVFNAWADIMTKLTALRTASNGSGRFTIEMDDSDASITIPAGSHDMTNVDWVGLGRSTLVAVTVSDGASLPGLRTISQSLTLLWAGTSSPITDMVDGDQFTAVDSSIQVQSGATAGFFNLSTASGTVSFHLINASFVNAGGGAVVRGIPLGVSVVADVSDVGSFGDTIFAGSGGLFITWSESSFFSETQSVGSVTLVSRSPEKYPVITSAINFTATAGNVHLVDTSGGTRVVTLPAAYNARGSAVFIKNTGGTNSITVNRAGSDTIDGVTSVSIPPLGSMTLISNGLNPGIWNIEAAVNPPDFVPIVTSSVDFTATSGAANLVDTSGGNRIVTLPTISSSNKGQRTTIQNTGATNTVTVNRGGSDTIDGQTTYLVPQLAALTLVSDGAGVWHIVAEARQRDYLPILSSNVDFTATSGYTNLVDTSGGNRIVTLPAITTNNKGRRTIIKQISATNIITVNPTGADTIDGAASYVINTNRGALTLISDGVGDWKIVAEKRNIIGAPTEVMRKTVAMAVDAETDQGTFQVVGDFAFDPTTYNLTGTTKVIRFLVVGLVTNIATTGDIQLYNLTDAAVVSTLSFTGAGSSTPAKQTSASLVLPSSEKMYEIRIRVTGGTPPTDKVFAMWAGFQIDNTF